MHVTRRTNSGNRGYGRRKIYRLVLLTLFLLIFTACTGSSKKRTQRPQESTNKEASQKDEEVSHEEIEKELIKKAPGTTVQPSDAPRRRASIQIVDQGLVFLNKGDYPQAKKTFEDSINIDPTNGIAYFYLSLTRYYLEEYSEALGILDKADNLLRNSTQWEDPLANLRDLITERESS